MSSAGPEKRKQFRAPLICPQLLPEAVKGSGQPHTSRTLKPERWMHCSTAFSSCCRWTGERGWDKNSRQEDRVNRASERVIARLLPAA